MEYAYDLDGTLAITKEVIRLAYQMAGVDPPEGFYGKPSKDWLPALVGDEKAELIHMKKNEMYLQLISEGKVRPTKLASMFKMTGGIIITGASAIAAHAVCISLGLYPAAIHSGLTMAEKAKILNSSFSTGIVFEDDTMTATYLKERTRWTVCHVL